MITPQGPVATRRVPSSGAGPSADGLFLGSGATDGQARLTLGFEGVDAPLLQGALAIRAAHGACRVIR